jgi:hypothetical protein
LPTSTRQGDKKGGKNVKTKIMTMFTIAVVSMVTVTHADVLTFDDIITVVNAEFIPNGYGGLNWDNMAVAHKDVITNSGYNNGTVSGNYIALNSAGTAASVSDGTFSFNGAYLTAAWNTGLNINLKGYNSGGLVYDQTVVVDTDAPTWFGFNFNNIDNLVFESSGGVAAGFSEGSGTQFVMDDFTYVIPEPASLSLIGLVVGGLYFTRRFFPAV